MNQFSAEYIFPITSPPIKNGTVTTDEKGKIISITETDNSAEKLNGIIVPGLINTHCHLELSYLRGRVAENEGMANFIKELVGQREKSTDDEIRAAVIAGENEMIKNGIVAVGDISNTHHTFEQKKKQNLFYHTFIEVFDLNPEKAATVFNTALDLQSIINPLASTIVPHAPYTVSPQLFALLNTLPQGLVCIHNQESMAEENLFKNKTGQLLELFANIGLSLEWLCANEKNSMYYSLPQMLNAKKIQLVHNTYTSKNDLDWAKYLAGKSKLMLYFCTCPNANLYIENRLPNYDLFIAEDINVTIGTDSLASNWSLSILDELKTIQHNFPHINIDILLEWATINGARFLEIDNNFGSIEVGKSPGLNFLQNVNIDTMKLNPETCIKKLL